MSDIALEFAHVWKKFTKGEKHSSLRDFIPALTRNLFSRNGGGELRDKEFWALKDVSFQVKKGEALGIIGPNGSGKSTTLKLLSGILRPTKGEMKVNGRLSALIEVGAGFHPDLTGRENVYLNGAILGMKKDEIRMKFKEIVEFSELEDFIDTPVKRYSSGMYARLGFSVAAHLEPDILLVDEVLSVGDISFQTKCVEKILQLKKEKATIIFISHNMQAVLSLCERSILLVKGEVVSNEATETVVKHYNGKLGQRLATAKPREDEHGPITIRAVAFFDQNGAEKLSFRTGDTIRVIITLEAKQKISKPVLGIAFYDDKGICIYGHNSKIDKYEFGDIYGMCEIAIEYENVNLQRGTYLVTVAVFDSLAINSYDCKDRFYSFSIDGDHGEIGLVKIPHSWCRAFSELRQG